jgi:curved DNA-binding protein CbpA
MNKKDWVKAIKWFDKCLRLYPLPGVAGMLQRCKEEQASAASQSSSSSSRPASRPSAPRQPQAPDPRGGETRDYTPEQSAVVQEIISSTKSKSQRDTLHYRVLGIPKNADAADIKKAYRKKSLKVHPDKNPSPGSAEAFKAVGLAYSVLSDVDKRHDYDRFGDEDPDNPSSGGNPFSGRRTGRGGGQAGPFGGGGGGGGDAEDIFNMFFGGGGGMGGGGGQGFRVYSGGMGGGSPFGNFGQPQQRRRPATNNNGEQQRETPQAQGGWGLLIQLLPLLYLFLFMTSFFSGGDDPSSASSVGGMGGGANSHYFSLTRKAPYVHPLETSQKGVVKDIPFYVTDKFLRSHARDPYQLAQVERLVERAYDQYLINECQSQRSHKRKLEQRAVNFRGAAEQKEAELRRAREYELTRCDERRDLFANKKQGSGKKSMGY